ncbi:MAG: hypothetical protein B7733_13670 [Myxococcales bacterium FL481]|nr:MAG: hypothetical protein B7733_13670 [Myxococcales bacterium FL481]
MTITRQDIEQAQKTWGDGLIAIGAAHREGQDFRQIAADHVDKLYAYASGPVLFKPTKAKEIPFRTTRAGALSYFVAGDTAFPEDKGFALQPWVQVDFDNAEVVLGDNHALAMGQYVFTDPTGTKASVEYTFGYTRDEQGALRINVHHSSLPFAG